LSRATILFQTRIRNVGEADAHGALSRLSSNGQVIGTIEMYESEAARDNGIKSVQANSPSAEVKDLS
jgi:uncharacterized protein YegP (UPF0339 family)